jgi:hypothetical protein
MIKMLKTCLTFPFQISCFAQKLSFFQTSWIFRVTNRNVVVGFWLSIDQVAAPTVRVLGAPAANPLSY